MLADVQTHSGAAEARALDGSQRQWSVYTRRFCDSIDASGSIEPLLAANCSLVLTRQRIVDVCAWAIPASTLAAVADPPETCKAFHD